MLVVDPVKLAIDHVNVGDHEGGTWNVIGTLQPGKLDILGRANIR